MCETRYLITISSHLYFGTVRWDWEVKDTQKTWVKLVDEGTERFESNARNAAKEAINKYEFALDFKSERKVLTEADL